MHPKMKKNHYFTVKELEMFLELGHSSKEFHNLMEIHRKFQTNIPYLNTTPATIEEEKS
jgi:hypothetical protein